MLKKALTLVLIFAASSLTAKAQSFKDIDLSLYSNAIEAIDPSQLEHPYLVFDKDGCNAIKEKIASKADYAEYFLKLMKYGEDILARTTDQEMQLPLRDMQARAKNVSDPYDIYIHGRSGDAVVLALLYQISGDERFARKAYEYASDVCSVDSWMTGAHLFDNIYNRVWPYGAADDQVVFTYDLYAAMITCKMSLVYDWLHPVLNKAERDRLRGGLLDKAVLRAAGAYDYHWWTNAVRCNWCGINHASIGLAALAVLKENPELKWVVNRSCRGVNDMLANMDSEGGWQEGRHYLHFALDNMINFMNAMCNVTAGAVNLYNIEPIKSHSTDFMLYGLTGNFCDSNSEGREMRRFLVSHLAARTKDPVAMWFLENFYPEDKFMEGWVFGLIYDDPENLPAVKPADASKHFPDIDWAFMRKDFGDEYVQVATKAGKSDDPHHGHLDNGTVNITWMGETIVGEFRRTFYDLKVFDEDRFDYLHVQSRGHNVVLVDDCEQQMSKHKDKPWGHIYGGTIDRFSSKGDYASALMDLTNAYDGKSLKLWKRAIVLDKERNGVIILDQVGCDKGAKIDVLFHPMVKADITADRKHVDLHGKRAHMQMLALASAPFKIVDVKQQYIMQMVNFDPVDIPCYSVRMAARRETSCIASIFYPDGVNVKGRISTDTTNPSLLLNINGHRLNVKVSEGRISISAL